jgi:hypothetical protein
MKRATKKKPGVDAIHVLCPFHLHTTYIDGTFESGFHTALMVVDPAGGLFF